MHCSLCCVHTPESLTLELEQLVQPLVCWCWYAQSCVYPQRLQQQQQQPRVQTSDPLLQMCFHFLEAFTRVCDVYTHTYVRSTRWKRCGKYFRKWQQKAGSFAGPNFISIKIWRGKRDECVRETDRDQASQPPQLLSCCLPAVVCTMRHRQEFGGALTRAAHGVDRYGK